MFGTILNVVGILAGGITGLIRRKPLSPGTDSFAKVMLGAFTVYYGLRLTWISLNGSALQILKQLIVAVVALMLGKLTGRLLRLQQFSNSVGRGARDRITKARPGDPQRLADGLKVCAALYCAAPLGILGAIQDGLSNYFYPLAVKGCIEGLATFGFVSLFGWGALLAVLPVLAFQGTITLATKFLAEPFLAAHSLVDPVNATGGLLVFAVALVILGLKRIELADYLPSLIVAPALAWVFS